MQIQYFTLSEARDKYSTFIQKEYAHSLQKPSTDFDETHFIIGIELTENKEIVALCCLYENPFINEEENQKCLLIGNFECVKSKVIAHHLFNEINRFAKEKDFSQLIGPINGSTWNSYRFKVNTSTSFFSESIHPSFYPSLWKENDFVEMEHYFSTETSEMSLFDEKRMQLLEEKAISQSVVFRSIDVANFEDELDQLAKSSLLLFAKNRLYSPISVAQFIQKYLPLKPILHPDFVWLAEKKQQILAFNLCFIDPFEPTTLIMKTIATQTGKETLGFTYILANKIIQKAKASGITKIIHAYMYKNNVSNRLSERYDSKNRAKYVLFKRTVK